MIPYLIFGLLPDLELSWALIPVEHPEKGKSIIGNRFVLMLTVLIQNWKFVNQFPMKLH